MKKSNVLSHIAVCLFCVVATATAWADNIVRISSATGIPRPEVDVSVSLSNTDDVTGLQIELDLPEQLSFVSGSAALNNDRSDGHSITASQKDGKLNLVVYSLSQKKLKGNDGQLLKFRLKLGDDPGVFALQPTVILAGLASASLDCTVNEPNVTILASRLVVETSSVEFGHIALGGKYTESAIVKNIGTKALLVKSIEHQIEGLQFDSSSFSLAAGATRTIQLTYSPVERGIFQKTLTIHSDADNGDQTLDIAADPYAVNELHTGNASGISDSEVSVALSMNNMDPIIGVQCSYNLPEELQYVDGSVVLSDRSDGHKVSATVNGDVLTIIVYSTIRTPLKGNEGDLLTFRLLLKGRNGSYKLDPEKVVLGMDGSVNVVSGTSSGTVSVDCPKLQVVDQLVMPAAPLPNSASGALVLSNPSVLPLTISDITFMDEGYAVSEAFPMVITALSDTTLTLTYQGDCAGDFSSVLNIYSNDPDQRMRTVSVSGSFYEPNVVSIEQTSVANGNYVFAISAENYSLLSGMRADILLEGVSSASIKASLSSRTSDYAVSLKQVDDDVWRVLVYSFDKSSCFEGHSGVLLNLTLSGVDLLSPDAAIALNNVVLSGYGDENLFTSGGQMRCTVSSSLSTRHIINIYAYSGDSIVDKTRVVFNEEKSMSYEYDCDAAKFMTPKAMFQLYSLDTERTNYSINERPEGVGCVPLGIKVEKEGEYSIKAVRMDVPVILYDRYTSMLHELTSAYSFTASSGTFDDRFQLLTITDENQPDVNGDNETTIADLSGIIGVLNGTSGINVNVSSADVNGNNRITLEDIKALQEIIMKPS